MGYGRLEKDNIFCHTCKKQIIKDRKSVPGVGWYVDGPFYDCNDYCSKDCRFTGMEKKRENSQ